MREHYNANQSNIPHHEAEFRRIFEPTNNELMRYRLNRELPQRAQEVACTVLYTQREQSGFNGNKVSFSDRIRGLDLGASLRQLGNCFQKGLESPTILQEALPSLVQNVRDFNQQFDGMKSPIIKKDPAYTEYTNLALQWSERLYLDFLESPHSTQAQMDIISILSNLTQKNEHKNPHYGMLAISKLLLAGRHELVANLLELPDPLVRIDGTDSIEQHYLGITNPKSPIPDMDIFLSRLYPPVIQVAHDQIKQNGLNKIHSSSALNLIMPMTYAIQYDEQVTKALAEKDFNPTKAADNLVLQAANRMREHPQDIPLHTDMSKLFEALAALYDFGGKSSELPHIITFPFMLRMYDTKIRQFRTTTTSATYREFEQIAQLLGVDMNKLSKYYLIQSFTEYAQGEFRDS